ncbi:hypothetical protein Pan216_19040 [Planctomycetes bacterium Pan216]|uniref:Uncharacterized protein n=1 Tax=Kolteria novifilia TaxID=2527975 RepID=A0A518B236_9BACT|nr:hypothetical protein Pan216_19040 [Planctomycetes bacterium Pan216]
MVEANDVERRITEELAHAWMVRTFVKHSPEAEDFPELMQVVRTIFDCSRAIEAREGNPEAMVAMLKKKLSKLRRAAEQFREDAPKASTHTNFVQAVISLDACIASLGRLAEVEIANLADSMGSADATPS